MLLSGFEPGTPNGGWSGRQEEYMLLAHAATNRGHRA